MIFLLQLNLFKIHILFTNYSDTNHPALMNSGTQQYLMKNVLTEFLNFSKHLFFNLVKKFKAPK